MPGDQKTVAGEGGPGKTLPVKQVGQRTSYPYTVQVVYEDKVYEVDPEVILDPEDRRGG
ncbi:MAG: hypothetical protein GWN71_10545 [Gammaproteobacteria bacterium]|nr:hypothetical protein [Gemmatimonadota bacterium]NIU74001.1 hypothetical protein [Gammaproteobacteria bacterium]